MDRQFRHLFSPVRLGELDLKNRIVMSPMVTNYSDEGFVTERLKEYYAARARGGVGLVIIEACCVDTPVGKSTKGELSIDHDRYVPGLADLASAVRRNGAKIVLQLHHAGAQTASSVTGLQPVGPSPIAFPMPGSDMPREHPSCSGAWDVYRTSARYAGALLAAFF